MVLVVLMSALSNKVYFDGTILALISLIFLGTMSIITGAALLRQHSPKVCLVNFLLIAFFVGVLSGGFVYRQQYLIHDSMKRHIVVLENALKKEGVAFKSYWDRQ